MTNSKYDAANNKPSLGFENLGPETIFQSIESQLDVRCTGTMFQLNSMENRVYQIEIEETEKYPSMLVTKFYRPGRWSEQQIGDEHAFMYDLKMAEVSIEAPLPLGNGQTFAKSSDGTFYFAVWKRFYGRAMDEALDDQLMQLGRLVARIHNVGSVKSADHRLRLNPDNFLSPALDYLLGSKQIPLQYEKEYQQLCLQVIREGQPKFDDLDYIRVHGDFHLGNILLSPAGLCVVDFDDMAMGPPVQDLWLLIPEQNLAANPRFHKILRGYEQMREFSDSSLQIIEVLRFMRMVHFSAWIGRRWSDPYFKKAFPLFGSDTYWQDQLHSLRCQIQEIAKMA